MQPTGTVSESPSMPLTTNLKDFGVPPLFRDALLSDFGATLLASLGHVASAPGYYVWGDTGRGKTRLACAILREWILAGRAVARTSGYLRPQTSALWLSVPPWLADIKRSWDDKHASEAFIVRAAKHTRAVVLDDIGAERMTDWSLGVLYELIDHRVNYEMPTVVTSNLTIGQVSSHSPRLASRYGGWRVIHLTGTDRRLEKESE